MRFDDWRRRVAWDSVDNVGAGLELLSSLDPLQLVELLAALPDEKLSVMSGESYLHETGFEKITIPVALNSAVRLRIHIWPGGLAADSVAPDAHNHKWPVVSRVLAGGVRSSTFRVAESGPNSHRHYIHRRVPPGYSFEYAGLVRLEPESATVHRAGCTYQLPPEAIHTVSSATPYSATLVVQLPQVRQETDVFTHDSVKSTGSVVTPQRYTPVEIRARLTLLRERLLSDR
jgi:hypothetical protein